jgi:hypothetical protein
MQSDPLAIIGDRMDPTIATSREAIRVAVTPDETRIDELRIRVLPGNRISAHDTARYIGCSYKTLCHWQMKKIAPASIKIRGKRYYYRQAVDAFIQGEKK